MSFLLLLIILLKVLINRHHLLFIQLSDAIENRNMGNSSICVPSVITSLTVPVNQVCISMPSMISFRPSSLIPLALQLTQGTDNLNTPS